MVVTHRVEACGRRVKSLYDCPTHTGIDTASQAMMNAHNPTTKRYQLRQNWGQFRAIQQTLSRQAELERLVAWAERKCLPSPRRCYEEWLTEIDRRLFRWSVEAPRMVRWARGVHALSAVLFPEPAYHRSGSAAGYARHNLMKNRRRKWGGKA